MNAPDKLRSKSCVNRSVPFKPVQIRKGIGLDRHAKMTLPALLIPRMTPVLLAFIQHDQTARREGVLQLLADFVFHSHFSRFAPSISLPPR